MKSKKANKKRRTGAFSALDKLVDKWAVETVNCYLKAWPDKKAIPNKPHENCTVADITFEVGTDGHPKYAVLLFKTRLSVVDSKCPLVAIKHGYHSVAFCTPKQFGMAFPKLLGAKPNSGLAKKRGRKK